MSCQILNDVTLVSKAWLGHINEVNIIPILFGYWRTHQKLIGSFRICRKYICDGLSCSSAILNTGRDGLTRQKKGNGFLAWVKICWLVENKLREFWPLKDRKGVNNVVMLMERHEEVFVGDREKSGLFLTYIIISKYIRYILSFGMMARAVETY